MEFGEYIKAVDKAIFLQKTRKKREKRKTKNHSSFARMFLEKIPCKQNTFCELELQRKEKKSKAP